VYTVYLFTQGRVEGRKVEPERRLKGQQLTTGSKICTNMTDSISSL